MSRDDAAFRRATAATWRASWIEGGDERSGAAAEMSQFADKRSLAQSARADGSLLGELACTKFAADLIDLAAVQSEFAADCSKSWAVLIGDVPVFATVLAVWTVPAAKRIDRTVSSSQVANVRRGKTAQSN